ncbi:vomeronasal type-2 receptor 26-like [Engystomops pustulosus]|uniref:vomeronasal type-2 receptor 26-like n=1 Tax=Engystomops pustulosus TaxID=76066 RepID=UPI003AFAC8EF
MSHLTQGPFGVLPQASNSVEFIEDTSTESSLQKTLLCVFFLFLSPCIFTGQTPAPACRLDIEKLWEDYEYVKDGDVMIGGVVSVNIQVIPFGYFTSKRCFSMCETVHPPYYKNLVAFFYAVDEINKNPSILPNLTLGYHIYDSCSDYKVAIKSIIQILSGPGNAVPDYSCTRKKKVVGFIGDHFTSTTLPIAQLLGIYPYTQISYGATDTLLSDRNLFPSLFRTVPDDNTTYYVIAYTIENLGWNWVGIIASDDEAGDRETRLLTNLLASRGICVAFVLQCGDPFKYVKKEKQEIYSEEIRKSSAKIIILCGTHSDHMLSFLSMLKDVIEDRTFILSPNFSPLSFFNTYYNIQVVNLSLSFALNPGKVLDLESYLMNSSVLKNPEDLLLRDISIEFFHCSTASKSKDENMFAHLYSWPNENRTSCVLKDLEYLSYAEDIISIALFCSSLFFCIMTVLLLFVFGLNHNTPIVIAKNKNLSFVLLVSIMLSFLCVFLFLGRPVEITCMLRQISTGIFLSVSISSLLAKTIMVYIAFKATRPGSVWRTWTGVRLPNCVLLICSSVQVVLCMSWVTLSPPFQELDTHSYKEKVVVQCNEGSDLWFYSVLGYMGVLTAVSFITAFLARTLPDSFNEAKYITFSMLVFCSVWIAMIPAYLSTRGKYMVAVEIFAILTSNAGLLGCIFLPKCYIILFKPELNTRKYILEHKQAILH